MKWMVRTCAVICAFCVGAAAAGDRVLLGVANAYQAFDPTNKEPVINIALDREGRARMAEFSSENAGRTVDLYVGDEIVASPLIREPILGGYVQISKFEVVEATILAVRLRNGTATLVVAVRE